MTTTAHWLHLKLGLPLADDDAEDVVSDAEAHISDADLIARQKAFAAAPLTVHFMER